MPYSNTRSNTASREKLVLQVGKPVTIALEFATGKPVSYRSTEQIEVYWHRLTDAGVGTPISQ